jgi:hypothetical protein
MERCETYKMMDWPEKIFIGPKDRLLSWIFGIDDNNTVRDCSNINNSNNDNASNRSSYFKFEIPTAVTMKIIFWDETACSFGCRYERFGVIFRL